MFSVGASPSKRSSKPKAKATNFGEPLLDSARIHAAAGAGASRQQGQGGQPQVLNPFSVLDGNREPIRQHSMFMNADKAQQAAGGAGGASAPAATGASSQAGLTFSSQTAGGFSFPASQLQQQQQAGAGGTGFVWPQPHATQQPPAPTAPAMAFGGAAIMANAGSQAPPAGTSGVSFSMGQKDNAPTPSRSHRRSKPAPTQAAAAPEVARAASFQGFGSDAGGPAGGASTPVFGRYAAAGAGATAAGPDQQQANRSPSVAPMSTQQAGPAAQQQQQQPVFGGVGDFAPMSVQQPAAPAATPLTAQFSAMSIDPVTLEPQAGVAAASGTPATAQQEMPVRKLFQTPSPFGGFKTAAAELSPQEQGGPPSPFGMFGATAVPSFSLGAKGGDTPTPFGARGAAAGRKRQGARTPGAAAKPRSPSKAAAGPVPFTGFSEPAADAPAASVQQQSQQPQAAAAAASGVTWPPAAAAGSTGGPAAVPSHASSIGTSGGFAWPPASSTTQGQFGANQQQQQQQQVPPPAAGATPVPAAAAASSRPSPGGAEAMAWSPIDPAAAQPVGATGAGSPRRAAAAAAAQQAAAAAAAAAVAAGGGPEEVQELAEHLREAATVQQQPQRQQQQEPGGPRLQQQMGSLHIGDPPAAGAAAAFHVGSSSTGDNASSSQAGSRTPGSRLRAKRGKQRTPAAAKPAAGAAAAAAPASDAQGAAGVHVHSSGWFKPFAQAPPAGEPGSGISKGHGSFGGFLFKQPTSSSAAAGVQSDAGRQAAGAAGAVGQGGAAGPAQQQQQQQQQGPGSPAFQFTAEPSIDRKTAAAVADAHVWRQRGGNSHKAGNYSRAQAEYSKGIAALQGCTGQEELLAVLYNNRAAAALMLQQAQAALEDALMAQQLNSSYLGAYLRLASCHQRMGDLPAALAVLGAAQQLPGVNPRSSDGQRVSAKLAEAQQLQQQLVEVQQWVAGRGLKGSAASSRGSEVVPREQQGQQLLGVMESLVAAMPSCGEVKVLRALLLLCTGQHTAAAAAAGQVTPPKGAPAGSTGGTPGRPAHVAGDSGAGSIAGHARSAWQQWIKAQGEYHKGELVKAQHLLQDLVNHISSKPAPAAAQPTAASSSSNGSSKSGAGSKGSSAAQLLTELAPDAAALQAQLQQLQQLLAKKDAGNAAVQRKAVDEAVQQYTEALQLAPPAPFAAVLYCNRAAAYHSKSPPQWSDALADCGRALALNPGYAKAHSRMAQLLVEVRRADAAVPVLEELIQLCSSSSSNGAAAVDAATLRGYRSRLGQAQSAARRQTMPHHYRLLGVTDAAVEDDIRKCFKKMALRHHPDKALPSCRYSLSLGPQGAVLGCSSSIEARLKAQATNLFAYISTAHEELTDAVRRRKVDQLLEVEDLEAPAAARRSTSYGNTWDDLSSGFYSGFGSNAYSGNTYHSTFFNGSRGGFGGGRYEERANQYQSSQHYGNASSKPSGASGYSYRPAGGASGATAGGAQKPARNNSSGHAGGAGSSSGSQGWGQRGGGNAGRYTSASQQSSRPWWGDTAGQYSDGWETDSEDEAYAAGYRSHL